MRKEKLLTALLLCLGLLWGCVPAPAPTTQPTTGTVPLPTTVPTTIPTTIPTTVPTTTPTTTPSTLPTVPTTAPTVPSTAPTEPVTQPTEPVASALQYVDIKAMWLSQFDLWEVYRDGDQQREVGDFTARMAHILDKIQAMGFNTVFYQIRPNADSMYPSEHFPMSAYVAGQPGGYTAYDPVEIIVKLAHARGLSIHAWINPMRGLAEAELQHISSRYLLRQWYDDPQLRGTYLVLHQGRWYLNPAYGPVRELIAAGAREALTAYDFDGLHMDDYFYPTTQEAFDAPAYADYLASGGTGSLADFRRDSLSLLVEALHALTGASKAGRLFGISPAGNVDTVYNSQYADIYRWCAQPGYLDYICPQVYFGLEHGSHDFVKVCGQYRDMITCGEVDLLIGMTFGKALSQQDPWAGAGKNEWAEHQDVLARCLETTRKLPHCRGISVFCYQYFYDPVTGEAVQETAAERANFLPILKDITWQ